MSKCWVWKCASEVKCASELKVQCASECVAVDEANMSYTKLNDNQVWRAEFQIPADQINFCEDPKPEEALLFLASASKKQRSEVKLSTLDPAERTEFEEAKTKEIKNWLSTGTVSKIFRHELTPEQILGCRWLYVWKPVEDPIDQHALGGKTKKAKARLVVLGYQDPDLDTIPRDSPTLNRTSKMLIAQILASMGWLLSSFDIKAAFLQGKTQEGRKIAIEPVPEMRREMGLQQNEVCQLVKSAYGLIDAPYLWFQALDQKLKSLGFISAPFDPCLYVLHHPESKAISGILGVHVDDGLCGGDKYFQSKISELEKTFPFGSRKSQSFVFTGIEMCQENDNSITMSQEKYITKINPIHIHPDRKSNLDLPVTERERQDLRGLIGSLQYASVNTRPDLASRLSFLQSDINKATIATLIQGNKVLHEAKRYKDTKIRIQPIPLSKIRFLAFSDASFASQKSPESHTGTIIMTTHSDIANNNVCPVNPISWGCRKIQRVVTSTLSAETTSLSTSLDQLSWLKLYWGWLLNPDLDWKNATQTLKQLPTTYATATLKQDPSIAVTDCKSLYDLVTRTAPPNCSEFRVQLQARAIKDLLSEGTQLRWVHSGAQLADTLTKIMESHMLRHTLKSGMYSLHDESEILKKRASTRTRVKWLENQSTKENHNTEVLGVWMFNWTQQLSLVSWFICSRIWPRQARGGKGCGFLRLQPLEAEDGYRLWTAWLWVIDPTSSIRRLPVGSPILCAGRRKTDRRFAPALSLGWTTTASADTNHNNNVYICEIDLRMFIYVFPMPAWPVVNETKFDL